MSWLYNHRYQLDGLYPLAEIAYWAVVFAPPEDRDDLEQEIFLTLMATILKYGDKPQSYLKVVARNRFYRYLHKRYQERSRLAYYSEGKKGCTAEGPGEFLDARMDAIDTLATLPERLIQIGYKIENGEKLSEADQSYWRRQKEKLNCRRHKRHLSDWEEKRILKLNKEGISLCKIARTTGRSHKAIMRVLDGRQLSHQSWLAKMRVVWKERDERIRQAYFVDGKGISQIAREFHHGCHTIYRAIRSGEAGSD